jgi:DNA repair protein RadA
VSAKKRAEVTAVVSDECQQYKGPWKEDVVKLCGEYGLRNLAAMNVVELAQFLGKDDELERAELALAEIRRLAGLAPRPVNILEALNMTQQFPVLKTGVAEFDEMTPWGGLRKGLIYGFAGEFGAGKSMFAIQASVRAAMENWKVLFIETEGSLNNRLFERIAQRFGTELKALVDRLAITQTIDALDVKEILKGLHRQPVDLVVIDSFVSHALRAQFRGRERLAARQQFLNYLLDILRRAARVFGTVVILTDQVIDVPSFFSDKRPAGGNVVLHGVNALFMMMRPNKHKSEGYMWPIDVPGMAPDEKIRYEIKKDGLY